MPLLRLRALAVGLATAVLAPLAVAITAAPAAAGDPSYGFDVSWPQCPKGTGTIPGRQGLGLPMPPPESQFMIIGLTNGPAFTPNPCLASQVAYARDRGQWTAGYAVSSFPTDSQLAQYGGGGSRQQQLFSTGVAQARFNVANLRAAGLRTTLLWVDIEPVSSAPWSANPGENNAVIDGVLQGYAEAGLRTGWYSYKSAWDAITLGRRSLLPTWVPAGRSDRDGALRKCAEPSFSGGPVIFGQWTDTVYDFNVTCPGRSSADYLVPPDASRDPFGAHDEVRIAPGGLKTRGWALDPDTSEPIDVHVYAAGRAVPSRADLSRPDVGAAFGRGSAHGYDTFVPAGGGTYNVCVYGINRGPGYANTNVGCRAVSVPSNPLGRLDGVERVPGGVQVRGWSIDPKTAAPVTVHGYVGGTGTPFTADFSRPDVGGVFPEWGAGHGFNTVLPAPGSGSQRVCLYAIGGNNPNLGCGEVVVTHEPFGFFDGLARPDVGVVQVLGWALDPDTTAPLVVEVLADGVQVGTVTASDPRADVGAAFPRWGSARGFSATFNVPNDTVEVCLRAKDATTGPATDLGCRS